MINGGAKILAPPPAATVAAAAGNIPSNEGRHRPTARFFKVQARKSERDATGYSPDCNSSESAGLHVSAPTPFPPLDFCSSSLVLLRPQPSGPSRGHLIRSFSREAAETEEKSGAYRVESIGRAGGIKKRPWGRGAGGSRENLTSGCTNYLISA